MPMLYPLIFRPIFKERVWGGREIEKLFGKKLPPGRPIGESWEISDRPGDESIVANGPFAGNSLRWLMENHRVELLGDAKPAAGNRFPLLCKILDAREKLSLQVHPKSRGVGDEPKTEMWFVAHAAPDAELFVGLKRGVTRAEFEKKIESGTVAECFHRVPVRAGDVMFLPSGRVHAIGAGLVLFEIQQNSDTTYRVHDWGRVGLDGQPRELHVAQSLANIDFNDFEPQPVSERFSGSGKIKSRILVRDEFFDIEQLELKAGAAGKLKDRQLQIVAVVSGEVEVKTASKLAGGPPALRLMAGQFALVPACLEKIEVQANSNTTLLRVEAE